MTHAQTQNPLELTEWKSFSIFKGSMWFLFQNETLKIFKFLNLMDSNAKEEGWKEKEKISILTFLSKLLVFFRGNIKDNQHIIPGGDQLQFHFYLNSNI